MIHLSMEPVISVIIPALNEEAYLAQTIEAIKIGAGAHLLEIILVDSQSKDNTNYIARTSGCKVINSKPGNKWEPLNIGAKVAKGKILIFIDADTIMPNGFGAAIIKTMDNNRIVGGAFEYTIIEKGFKLGVVELVNRIRYRLWKRYYGDQSIFVLADIFNKVGGYPKREILEASHFCLNLKKYGKLKLIKMPALTSGRRFLDGGVWRVFLHDIRIWFLDKIGFSMDHHGQKYWFENKKRKL